MQAATRTSMNNHLQNFYKHKQSLNVNLAIGLIKSI